MVHNWALSAPHFHPHFERIRMVAGSLLRPFPCSLNRSHGTGLPHSVFWASSSLQGDYRGPGPKKDWVAGWVWKNREAVRSLPIIVGGVSLFAVLINRTVSGIAPVADASRAWETLSITTCCRSLVVVYDGCCVLQMGVASESPGRDAHAVSVDAPKLLEGSLCQGVTVSATQSYLANLSLYPGRSELPFLPINTQSVILQPLGNNGVAIIGGDTVRGFTASDQSWIALIGDKLDATLSKLDTIPLP